MSKNNKAKRTLKSKKKTKKEHSDVPQFINPKTGQSCVILEDKYGRKKVHSVAYLVAEAFVPNPQSLPYVIHKDGNKQNNRATNLEWSDTPEI